MTDRCIGIDLGTSNSCVAWMQDGDAEVLPNDFGEKLTASVVAYEANGDIRVGNSAKANTPKNPEFTVGSAKRLIGRYFFADEVARARSLVSYRIVESHKGSLTVKSTPGEGSTFVIRLPVSDLEVEDAVEGNTLVQPVTST